MFFSRLQLKDLIITCCKFISEIVIKATCENVKNNWTCKGNVIFNTVETYLRFFLSIREIYNLINTPFNMLEITDIVFIYFLRIS